MDKISNMEQLLHCLRQTILPLSNNERAYEGIDTFKGSPFEQLFNDFANGKYTPSSEMEGRLLITVICLTLLWPQYRNSYDDTGKLFLKNVTRSVMLIFNRPDLPSFDADSVYRAKAINHIHSQIICDLLKATFDISGAHSGSLEMVKEFYEPIDLNHEQRSFYDSTYASILERHKEHIQLYMKNSSIKV